MLIFFFFQAEDGIRDYKVTGVQTCALPISPLEPIMKFGINTFLFTSPFTNRSIKLFKQFKQWGFDSVELAIEDPSRSEEHTSELQSPCNLVCRLLLEKKKKKQKLKSIITHT